MTLNRLLQTSILAIVLLGLYQASLIVSDWRHSKIKNLDTPVSRRLPELTEHPSNKPRILLFGDSRMEEWSAPWPDDLFVINRGISGSTTFQALERINRDVLDHQPDWVIIQIGINDVVASRLLSNDKSKAALEKIAPNIKTITDTLSQRDIPFILMSVVPDLKTDWLRLLLWRGNLKAYVNQINKELTEIDFNRNIWLDSSTIFADEGKWHTRFSRDALHWNHQGYEKLTKVMVDLIDEHTKNQGS